MICSLLVGGAGLNAKRCSEAVEAVRSAALKWKVFAKEAEVGEDRSERIRSSMRTSL